MRSLLLSLVLLAALAAPAAADHPLEGTLSGVHADDFEGGSSNTRWRLDTGARTLDVLPTRLPALAPGGARVALDDEDPGAEVAGPVTAAAPQAAPALGGRRLAVIAVNFASAPAEPWTPQQLRERVFTAADSTSAFFREESHDQLWLTGRAGNLDGDVYGWYTLDTPTDGCPYAGWGSQARSAAAADGFSASDYQHVMYVFPPQPACGWAGLAYMPGSESWINGEPSVRVMGHELGHNLGLHHAGGWQCTGTGGEPVTLSATCNLNEYDDPFDVMGAHGHRHSHGWHLQRLGVLRAGNVQTVSESGTYAMTSALEPTDEPTTLRIARTRSESGTVLDWYYLEIRERGGVFDDFALDHRAVNGVSIRVNDDPLWTTRSRLLDTRPGPGAGMSDAALAPGETFSDGQVSVTTVSAGAGDATVTIDLDDGGPDIEAPSVPDGLSHSFTGAGVRLSWNPASDDTGVTAYPVYRDGVQVGSSAGTSLDDEGVPPGPHVYSVYAEDAAGNRSEASLPHPVTVGAAAPGPDPAPSAGPAAGPGPGPGTRAFEPAADRSAPVVRLARRRARGGWVLVARARDAGGVARLELLVDGRRVRAVSGTRLRYRWKPRRGRHRVVVRAYDANGNRATLEQRLGRPRR